MCKQKSTVLELRDEKIYKESVNKTTRELAQKYGMSVARINKIIAEQRNKPRRYIASINNISDEYLEHYQKVNKWTT